MRRFAGDSELTEAELRAAPVHWPRPSVLDVALTSLSRASARSSPRRPPRPASRPSATSCSASRTATATAPSCPSPTSSRATAGRFASRSSAAPRGPFRRRGLSITSVKVGDDSGSLRASWFNQPWIAPKLTPGSTFLLTGSRDKRGFRVSEYEFLSAAGGGDAGGRQLARSAPPTSPQDPRP